MKVLLIGGGGFIGHHLALNLSSRGFKVSIADNFSVNNVIPTIILENDIKRNLYNKFLRDRIELLIKAKVGIDLCDARDYNDLSYIINKRAKPDVVVHLAAIAHAGRSNKDPYSTFDHSLKTLENALDSSIKTGVVKQFVYFSSSMVYGEWGLMSELTEESETKPKGIYGVLKLAGEQIVKVHQEMYGLPYTIIRPSALYGERCISGRVVQKFIEAAIDGGTINILGGKGEKLDFTYIQDLIQGVVRAIGNEKAYNETFNITYGKGRSIHEVLDIIRKYFWVTAVVKERDGDFPIRGTLCVDKARRVLGYDPQFPIEIGVPKYLNWYRYQE